MIRRVLGMCLILLLVASAGCAHQREQFFPSNKPGGLWGTPRTSASGASTISQKPKTVGTKSDRVEQSARRSNAAHEDEPFDFDQAL